MDRYGGTRYNSLCDGSTWMIMAFVVIICGWPAFLDDGGVIPVTISCVIVALIVVMLKGTYYRIDGNNLVIYQFFMPNVFPIDKIETVSPTKSMISAPATSLTHRLAIKFSDRKVLKSSMPLIISPERQQEFIDELISINPQIKLKK